jgi:pyridoxamine 5'-phosphate oxidase
LLEWDGSTLHLIQVKRLSGPKATTAWIHSEATEGSIIGLAKGSRASEDLVCSHRWTAVDLSSGPSLSEITDPEQVPTLVLEGRLRIPRGARQMNALLCAYLAARQWHSSRDRTLDEADLNADPVLQFQNWLDEARASQIEEPEAMTLATIGPEGQPSARMVLLKQVSEAGFAFYTNYKSQKGRDLAANPRAALVFYWHQLHRQVRITGLVAKTSLEESRAYFQSRPRGAQLSAWASWQSSPIADREILEARVRKMEAKYPVGNLPLPPNWGGYRLCPDSIEFWQGRQNRLHDRLRYSRQPNGLWRIERLAP